MDEETVRVTLPLRKNLFYDRYASQLSAVERGELSNVKVIYHCNLNLGRRVNILERQKSQFKSKNGLYRYVKGEHLQFRYELCSIIHQSDHSIYFLATDHKEGISVVIKNLKNKAGLPWGGVEREINYLKFFTGDTLGDETVKILKSFYCRKNFFAVVEKMCLSLYHFAGINNNKLEPTFLNSIARELFLVLSAIQRKNLIHCNLSLGKVFITGNLPLKLKLGGFHSCCMFMDAVGLVLDKLNLNNYQPPEIVLVGDIGPTTDVWAAACIIYHLFTGKPAFEGDDKHDYIINIIEKLGTPSIEFLTTCRRKPVMELFDNAGNPLYCPRDYSNRLSSPTPSPSGRVRYRPGEISLTNLIKSSDPCLYDFLSKCFLWSPFDRMSVEDALQHPYLTRVSGINRE